MEAVTILNAPSSGPFTRAERDALPDDGRRHELLDGCLVVTPSPVWEHQRAQTRLLIALSLACTPEFEVLGAPFDVDLAVGTVLQPDVMVCRVTDFSSRSLDTAPRLAVEVLSPSTRRYDLHLKRAVFEEAGCPSYWVVDTDVPSVTVWELANGEYGTPRRWVGDEPAHLAAPFEVTITPSRLVGPVRRP